MHFLSKVLVGLIKLVMLTMFVMFLLGLLVFFKEIVRIIF